MIWEKSAKFWFETVARKPELQSLEAYFRQACELIVGQLLKGGRLLVCGNGGSAADSLHFVGELRKSYLQERPLSLQQKQALTALDTDLGSYLATRLQRSVRAVSLVSEVALMTAVANDNGADLVFAQQLIDFAESNDVFLGLSTSGNSRNVLLAALTAKSLGTPTVALTGPNASQLSKLCDVTLMAPGDHTQRIQESHLPIYHALCASIEAVLFSHE